MNIIVRKTVARSYERKLLAVALLLFTLVFHGTVCYAQSDVDDDIVLTDSTSTDWGGGGGGGLNPQEPDEAVTSLTLSPTLLTLEGGQLVKLVASVNPQASDKRIRWASSNSSIASVDNYGVVMGLSVGTTTITATAVGNESLEQTCSVTVTSDYTLPATGYILPWGKEEPWTMRYYFQEQSNYNDPARDAKGLDWKQLNYNDHLWPELTGPMGSNGIGYSAYNYVWEGEHNCFCLRREFYLPSVSDETVYTFYTQHDDDIQVFINGVEVFKQNGWTDQNVVSCNVPSSVFNRGRNLLAIFIKQNTGGAFLDYALYQQTPRVATQARLPNVPFEFYYNAKDYDEQDQSIPNQAYANLAGASLKLTDNLPEKIDDMLHITDRCEGFIDKWGKGSTESGAYFYRQGTDCMTIVAKVAPRLNTGNVSDFVSNRSGGYNYMWRIGDSNSSFLHTGTAYQGSRSLVLTSEQPQILSVRVDGANDHILLQNLTTGESKRVDGVNWGGGNNVFKFFYNDGGEYYLGDFYWIYYSFELLTDEQLAMFSENLPLVGDVNGDGVVNIADAAAVLNVMAGNSANNGDVNGDGVVNIADVAAVLNIMAGKQLNSINQQIN